MSKINERLLLILAIICIFIIIPTSFATDADETAIISDDNVVEDNGISISDDAFGGADESQDKAYQDASNDVELSDGLSAGNVIYVSVDGDDSGADGSQDKPYQSISKAVEKFDSSNNTNIFIKNGTYKFDGRVDITKDVIIVGESSTGVILDGNGNSSLFGIDSNNVRFTSLSFVNGYSEGGYGGAAAIAVDYIRNLVVEDCIFENNNGGAISSSSGMMEWYAADIQIKDSTFINNLKASGNGGAISASGMYSSLNVTNCTFINNFANSGGAIAINNPRKESFIKRSTFIGNNATTGSAIYMYNGHTLTITYNLFRNNNASNSSATIDVEAYAYNGLKKLSYGKNTFVDNVPSTELKYDGFEIVYLDKNDRIVGLDIETMNEGDNVNFTVTLTDDEGNPISGKKIKFTLTDYLKRVSTYTAYTNSLGQAIISLINQTAGTYRVTSSFDGDSMYDAVNATNSVKIKSHSSYNIVFNESIIKVKAGESYKVLATVCNEYITPVVFFTNYDITWRTHSGGIRYTSNGRISGSTFLVDALDFDLSTTSEYYYINFTATAESTTVTAKGTLIIDTSIPLPPVSEDIEVIYVAKDGNDEYGDGSENNPLQSIQVALYVNEVFGGNKTIFVKEGIYDISNYEIYDDVHIIGEKSKTIFRQTQGDDGMLYLDNGATTKFTNITFTNGLVAEYTLYGAVIVVRYTGSVAYFDGCEFLDNRGSSDGIMYVANNALAYINNCVFANNYAWTFNAAGAIEVLDAYLSVNNTVFANNTAAEGGAIFVAGDSYALIENSLFYQNKALNDSYAISGGGAIYVNNYNTHIYNCSFIENMAEVNGGAIYILTGMVDIDKCYFENNYVTGSGNGVGTAIASDSGYTVLLYVSNSIFVDNGYSRLIAIVNDLAEENEIIINTNYWGANTPSGTKDWVILKATANVTDIREGDLVEITVEFVSNSGGALKDSMHDFVLDLIPFIGTVDVDSITIVDNVAKFNYYATAVGNESILMNHGQVLYTLKFAVNQSDAVKKDVNANVSVNDAKTQIIVGLPNDITNNITVILDGVAYTVSPNDGVATLDISPLPGQHTARVSYAGDGNYKAYLSDELIFNVDKYDANLVVIVENVVAGEDILVNVTGNGFSGNVVLNINNKNYTVRVSNGQGSMVVDGLAAGTYTISAIFEGNEYFLNDNATTQLSVSDIIIDVIYVSVNGNDSGNGSYESPYATLSKALDRNKRLGGGKTIVVGEGNYTLNRYAITNDVYIVADGNVVISPSTKTNHLFIGGNVNVNLEGLTFINGNGILAGSIDMGSGNTGNDGKILTITNCSFINNTGIVGAITSYAETTISQSSFINNTAAGKDGFNQAIISIQDNYVNLKNNIFLNNDYVNDIIVSRVSGLANDNFWGSNDKPSDVSNKLEVSTWVCIVPSIDDDVRAKTNYAVSVEFKKTDNGINFADLDMAMPNLSVDLEAQNGLINPYTVIISNNVGIANYNISKKGSDRIDVNLYGNFIAGLEFTVDVPEYDKIYVSTTGNDSNSGSREAPLKTIQQALTQNKAVGGNKTIIILAGEYNEHNLIVDEAVTIIGEDAVINGENNNLFTISADVELSSIALANANVAITQQNGDLYVHDAEFMNNSKAIVSNSNLMIVNSTFTENSNAVEANNVTLINNCEFSKNTGAVVKLSNYATIVNSNFTQNSGVVVDISYADVDIFNSNFDANDIAVNAKDSQVEIIGNDFSNSLIKFDNSNVVLSENSNAKILLINSNITQATVEFIGASTVFARNGTIRLNATVADDMGNAISGSKITFTSNGEVIGTADVNDGVAILDIEFAKGNYVISGSYGADKDAIIKDGLLRIDVDYYWFIGDDKYETLEDAIAAAEIGDVIKGLPGVYEVGKLAIGHRYMSIQPWEIIKSITITSINDEPVTLKGSGMQMFFVDVGSDLTLKNIIVRDAGSSSDDGGAIGTLYDSNLVIINCTFINNTGGNGGAIYAMCNVEIKDTVFDSNHGLLAGAVEVVSYMSNSYSIENCTFINNNAKYAGALYNGGCELEVRDCKFISNTATVGGALFTNAGEITVINCDFISNKALDNDAVSSVSMGGAFHNMLADARFVGCNFIDNYADSLGGAIELENGYYGSVTWTYFDDCTFTNNTARDGGAIYLGETYDPYVKITSSIFESNTAENNGAAIYDNFGHVTVEDTKFSKNVAGGLDVIHVVGDIIESVEYAGELTLNNVTFRDNAADYVIFTTAHTVLKVSNSKIDNAGMFVFNRGSATLKNNTVTNSKDNVIENYGTLSLNKNTFDTIILNKKEISSVTYIVVLGNETKVVPIGENYVLKAILSDDNGNIIEGGNVIFVVEGSEIPAVYENNEFSADYLVTNGTHIVDATCDNDGLTQLKVKKATLISKLPSELAVNVPEAKVGQDATITVNVNQQATGNITVSINNKTYELTVKRGVASVNIPGLAAGEYAVEVTYFGDESYSPETKFATLTVSKVDDYRIDTDISVGKVGEDTTIKVILPNDANGNAVIAVDGRQYPVNVVDGRASIVVSGLDVGNHNVTVTFDGDDKYVNSTYSTTFKVAKMESYAKINAGNIALGDEMVIVITLPGDATGDVLVMVDNTPYPAIVENGIATVTIPDLDLGTYNVVATYNGDSQYLDCENTTSFNVTKHEASIEVNIPKVNPGESAVITINFPGDATGNVTVTSGTKTYTTSVKDGKAVITVTGLSGDVEVSYSGDDNYASKVITIPRNGAVITVEDVQMTYNDGTIFYARLTDSNGQALVGENITVKIGSKTYTGSTNSMGIVGFTVKTAAGKYTAVASFKGNSKYDATSQSSKVYILSKVRLTGYKNVVADYLTAAVYKVKALDEYGQAVGAGQTVKITVNGKTYSKKTDKNGYVTLKLKLPPKTYVVTAKYAGKTVKSKLIVKNILKANNVAKKKASVVKFTASLKTSKGKAIKNKVITFKVAGKTLKAKTNAKGIATISLKNLKVGKYAVKMTYVKATLKKTLTIKK